MEKTNKIAEIIHVVFNEICIIYDETEICFDSATTVIEKLSYSLELISYMDSKIITNEIWAATSPGYGREFDIEDLINDKFKILFHWRPEATTVQKMNKQLTQDLLLFFERQTHINNSITYPERTTIENLYKGVGQRLLKAYLDLNKVILVLKEMAELESKEMEKNINKAISHNIKLHPDKNAEFAFHLVNMYKNNYFIPANKDTSISDADVIWAFNEFLDAKLFDADWSYPPIIDEEPIIKPQSKQSDIIKKFPDYILHLQNNNLSESLRKEFSTEKGKAMRLLLAALENNNPPLFTIGYRQGKSIYKALCEFFQRDIGSYQSIFNYKIDPKFDQQDLDNTIIRLNHILNTLN